MGTPFRDTGLEPHPGDVVQLGNYSFSFQHLTRLITPQRTYTVEKVRYSELANPSGPRWRFTLVGVDTSMFGPDERMFRADDFELITTGNVDGCVDPNDAWDRAMKGI